MSASPSRENDSKQAWKLEAAKTADENCQRFYDFADILVVVPNLTSPVRPAAGTAQANQLLRALFGDKGVVCAAMSAADFKLIEAGKFDLRKPAAPDGAFFKVNRVISEKPSGRKGGITDSDCATEFLMLEMDRASKERQRVFWRAAIALGFPAISVTDSGGKSLHVILRIAAADKDAYKVTADRILHLLEPFIPDGTSRNPSRYTRLPGVIRGEGEDQRPQDLLYLNPAAPTWDWESEIVQTLTCFRGQALPVPEKVRSAISKSQERIQKEPGDVDVEDNKAFRRRLDAVLKGRVIDLEKFVIDADWHLFSSEPVKGLEGKHFIRCPWSDDHTGGGDDDSETDAYVFERTTTARFKWGFHCSHHGCQERQVIDLLEVAAEESPELFSGALLPDNDVQAAFESIPDISPPEQPVTVPESLLLGSPCDVDNVEIFRLLYKDRVRFFHDYNEWVVWDGSRWRRDDSGSAQRLAASVAAMRVKTAGSDDSLIKSAKFAGTAKAISNTLSLAESILPIASNSWHFDLDPFKLGCPNGTLDLKTGILRPAAPGEHITLQTRAKYVPTAMRPRWEQALGEFHPDNPDITAFLKRWFGYCLCGEANLDKMLIFHGAKGRNGKSTLIKVISHVMGDYCASMPSGFLSSTGRVASADAPTPSLMALRNRRLGVTSETNEGVALDESRVKMLTGGDVVTGRDMFGKRPVSFRLGSKIILSSNHRPEVRGTDPAIWARLILVEFKESFLGKEDLNLERDLMAEEEGILAWMVEGYQEYLKYGLKIPDEIVRSTDAYRAEQDTLKAFLDECVVLDPRRLERTNKPGLYQVYSAWAERNHVRPLWSATVFARKMKDRGFDDIKTCGEWHWVGVKCSTVTD